MHSAQDTHLYLLGFISSILIHFSRILEAFIRLLYLWDYQSLIDMNKVSYNIIYI